MKCWRQPVPSLRMLQKFIAPLLASLLLGSSLFAPMALASTAPPPVVSLDSTKKIHPLLQYAAKADPNKVVRVIVQKTDFNALGGGGLLGALFGPNVPGLQVTEDFTLLPAPLATLPATPLHAPAAVPNVRLRAPHGVAS